MLYAFSYTLENGNWYYMETKLLNVWKENIHEVIQKYMNIWIDYLKGCSVWVQKWDPTSELKLKVE